MNMKQKYMCICLSYEYAYHKKITKTVGKSKCKKESTHN